MLVTFEQIINSRDVLAVLGKEKMKALVAYKLQKNVSAINKELEHFDSVVKDLYEKYGDKDKNGKVSVPEENKKAYLEEINELLREEIEMKVLMIKIDDIQCDISPFDLMKIDWMLLE